MTDMIFTVIGICAGLKALGRILLFSFSIGHHLAGSRYLDTFSCKEPVHSSMLEREQTTLQQANLNPIRDCGGFLRHVNVVIELARMPFFRDVYGVSLPYGWYLLNTSDECRDNLVLCLHAILPQ